MIQTFFFALAILCAALSFVVKAVGKEIAWIPFRAVIFAVGKNHALSQEEINVMDAQVNVLNACCNAPERCIAKTYFRHLPLERLKVKAR